MAKIKLDDISAPQTTTVAPGKQKLSKLFNVRFKPYEFDILKENVAQTRESISMYINRLIDEDGGFKKKTL